MNPQAYKYSSDEALASHAEAGLRGQGAIVESNTRLRKSIEAMDATMKQMITVVERTGGTTEATIEKMRAATTVAIEAMEAATTAALSALTTTVKAMDESSSREQKRSNALGSKMLFVGIAAIVASVVQTLLSVLSHH